MIISSNRLAQQCPALASSNSIFTSIWMDVCMAFWFCRLIDVMQDLADLPSKQARGACREIRITVSRTKYKWIRILRRNQEPYREENESVAAMISELRRYWKVKDALSRSSFTSKMRMQINPHYKLGCGQLALLSIDPKSAVKAKHTSILSSPSLIL
jgi:hypothetical protein